MYKRVQDPLYCGTIRITMEENNFTKWLIVDKCTLQFL